MSEPLVSVLVPARDAAATVGEALASLLTSVGVDYEVVFVDHGSVDETRAIAAAAQRRGAPLRIVDVPREERFIAALEAGRAACRGRYLARLDADDLVHPHRLRDDVRMLDDDESLSAVGSRVRPFPLWRTFGGMRTYTAWQNTVLEPEEHAREIWIEQTICHPAATFRASRVSEVGGYRDGDFPEDYDLFLRLVAAGGALQKRRDVHVAWRQHEGSETWTHPRCSRDSIARAKAASMVPLFNLAERPVFIAGAGKEGGRIARALGEHDVVPALWFDVSDKRIGRVRYGRPVLHADELAAHKEAQPQAFLIGAVGTSGAREIVRSTFRAAGFVEAKDAVVVA
jgi:glycosyltransferase involved in cell wall biosynthesis